MIEAKLYEIDTTHTRDIGATIPTQAGIYNVEAAATSLVNANQALVQQAIAQGLIASTASNIDIALALIGSGLVQSSLLSSTVGFLGHGLTETGVTASTNTGFNLSLNATDTRSLDDVQMRVTDRQPATFRTGTKYPVTTSTYSTGLSTPASTASNATINGVSVASLLSQFAGGSSATIPQYTYEDLGLTLKATPTIQRSGRIYMVLDLKIEALTGSSANGIPLLGSRQFTSNITVADGESAMMISNVNRSESSAVTGIPGLSELPGFQMPTDQNAEKDTGQLVVVVTPHVVHRRSDMAAGPRFAIRSVGPATGN
jgi:general secretion pathway protein D